jgi:hypothetical protein
MAILRIPTRRKAALAAHEQGLQRSLNALNRRVDWIPFGWQKLYVDLRLSLLGIDCQKRDGIEIEGAYEEDGLLYVDSSAPDPVVHGVLRKARAKAATTCMVCGRAGKGRDFDWDRLTLCGRCAGLTGLHFEVKRLLSLDRCGTIDLRSELQVSAHTALVREAWRASSAPPLDEIAHVDTSAVRIWLERLLDSTQEHSPWD